MALHRRVEEQGEALEKLQVQRQRENVSLLPISGSTCQENGDVEKLRKELQEQARIVRRCIQDHSPASTKTVQTHTSTEDVETIWSSKCWNQAGRGDKHHKRWSWRNIIGPCHGGFLGHNSQITGPSDNSFLRHVQWLKSENGDCDWKPLSPAWRGKSTIVVPVATKEGLQIHDVPLMKSQN